MLGQSPESHLLLQEKSCKEKYFAHAEQFHHAVLDGWSSTLACAKQGLFYLSLS
jgi:hypothetical protein